MNAHLQPLNTYLESVLRTWNCPESSAPHAARALLEALAPSGDPQQGWTQSVEHLAVARVLYRLEGLETMQKYLASAYVPRQRATAIALAKLPQPIHSCAALLDTGVLQKHEWAYSGLEQDWSLNLDHLLNSPEGLDLGVYVAIKQTLAFISPVWDAQRGRGRLTLVGADLKSDQRLLDYLTACLAQLKQNRGWDESPTLDTP